MKRRRTFPYVHEYTDKSGNPRAYLRKPGHLRVALPWPVGTDEFKAAYHAAMAGETTTAGVAASKASPGTINSLFAKYYASAGFLGLAAATQRNYKSVLEPFRSAHGDKRLVGLRREHINAILNKRALTSTAQAKNLGKRLSTLFKFGLDFGLISENPMIGVKRVKHEETHYEMWTDDDVTKFREFWKEGTPQRVALEILLYTGLRRSDAVRLGPQHFKNGIFTIVAQKTGVQLNIPAHPILRKNLAGHDRKHLVYIITKNETSRSEKAFTNWLKEAATKAGLPPSRSPHGLRRAACRALAEAGCTVWEIMAITGHQSSKEVEAYVADVDKKKLAKSAIAKWEATS